MGVSNEAKDVIPLKFLRKLKKKNPLVRPIRGHTVDDDVITLTRSTLYKKMLRQ
jgi:hypothetical protein